MKQQLKPLLDTLNNPSLPGIELSLERMERLLSALGHPETKLPPVIHVAGTNGKGSTIAYLRAIYEAAGYKVHAYTSPHLVRFNERIVIANNEASDAMLVPYLERVAKMAKRIPVTFFEATTAAAFLAFAAHKADVVLLETGLGGRLDATNMVPQPMATIITPIGLDHQEFLGNSIEAIAAEKAGIIKHGVPVFVANQEPAALRVIRARAKETSSPIVEYGQAWNYENNASGLRIFWGGVAWQASVPSLPGDHQYANAALAATAALTLRPWLKIDLEHLVEGIAHAHWPARLQLLHKGPIVSAWKGNVWLDGGHNAAAGAVLADWIKRQNAAVSMVVGMMQRKDSEAFFRPFAELPVTIACVPIPGHVDAYASDQLAKSAKAAGCRDVVMAPSPVAATEMLAHTQNGVLLVTGSLFLAGELLKTHA